jgi:hypothetical protein
MDFWELPMGQRSRGRGGLAWRRERAVLHASQHVRADCCNTRDRSTAVDNTLVRFGAPFSRVVAIALAAVTGCDRRGGLVNRRQSQEGLHDTPSSVSLRLVRFPITPSFSSPSGALARVQILPPSALDRRRTPCLTRPHPATYSIAPLPPAISQSITRVTGLHPPTAPSHAAAARTPIVYQTPPSPQARLMVALAAS